MQVTITRAQALFALAALSCMVAVSAALAGPTDSRAPRATTSASVTKQIKKLKRRLAVLETRSGVPGPQGPRGVQGNPGSSATINGVTAGGDLTGTFPDPTIKPGAIPVAESQELGGSTVNLSTDRQNWLAPVGPTTNPTQGSVNVSLGVSSTPMTIGNFTAHVNVPPGSPEVPEGAWYFEWWINGGIDDGGSEPRACSITYLQTSCTDSATHPVPAGATLALSAGSNPDYTTPARVTFGWTASP